MEPFWSKPKLSISMRFIHAAILKWVFIPIGFILTIIRCYHLKIVSRLNQHHSSLACPYYQDF